MGIEDRIARRQNIVPTRVRTHAWFAHEHFVPAPHKR